MSSDCPALLSAFSAELSAMAGMVETLSRLVAEHVRQAQGPARALALVEAQTIDALSQRLHALSGLACAVARGEALPAAIDGVPLADLSNRLRTTVLSLAPIADERASAGELTLFD